MCSQRDIPNASPSSSAVFTDSKPTADTVPYLCSDVQLLMAQLHLTLLKACHVADVEGYHNLRSLATTTLTVQWSTLGDLASLSPINGRGTVCHHPFKLQRHSLPSNKNWRHSLDHSSFVDHWADTAHSTISCNTSQTMQSAPQHTCDTRHSN